MSRQLRDDAGALYRLALCAKESALFIERVKELERRGFDVGSAREQDRLGEARRDRDEKLKACEDAINNAYPELFG